MGFQGLPFAAHYAATKAYVQALAEALAVELAPRGVMSLVPFRAQPTVVLPPAPG